MVGASMFEHKSGVILNGDCLELMKQIPSASVDMILCDLPYGTTQNKWDSVIPFEPLWAAYKRIIKPRGAIVLTGAEPFSSLLRLSNLEWFKYDWIWKKSKKSGFTNAKLMPLRQHKTISVFSSGTIANKSSNLMPYYPQDLVFSGKIVKGTKSVKGDTAGHHYGRPSQKEKHFQEFTNYPTTVIDINNEGTNLHPTQKPVALFEYLIKTYTQPGETVLDNCSGSGTTAMAAHNTGRRSICIERDSAYFYDSCARVWGAQNV